MGQRCSIPGASTASVANGKPMLQGDSCMQCRPQELRLGCPPSVDEQEASYQRVLEQGIDGSGAVRWLNDKEISSQETTHVENMMVPQGGVYIGQVRGDGQPHGIGTQKWPDGTVYSGAWLSGAAHGRGKLSKSDGSGYEGQWCEGRKHGLGSEWLVDQSEYSGEFADGQKHGSGSFKWHSGTSYTGDFCEDALHGEGAFEWDDGRRYRGQWVQSRMHGQGRFEWPDAKAFEGKYESDKKHGPGVFTWADGSKCVGIWLFGKQHGLGTHINERGVTRKGRWHGGSLEQWLESPPALAQPLPRDSEPVCEEPDIIGNKLVVAHA
mmetsp:Transcript_14875/g.52171  ORF Transcript_14875/g.52171 Transcript_14875/m.52171 type:complete len:323 (-) Transcript_14875:39-1007(-)